MAEPITTVAPQMDYAPSFRLQRRRQLNADNTVTSERIHDDPRSAITRLVPADPLLDRPPHHGRTSPDPSTRHASPARRCPSAVQPVVPQPYDPLQFAPCDGVGHAVPVTLIRGSDRW
jgi:hypothetical protein